MYENLAYCGLSDDDDGDDDTGNFDADTGEAVPDVVVPLATAWVDDYETRTEGGDVTSSPPRSSNIPV